MAYRTGNRYQMAMLPQSIEHYVSEDDPVRAYDTFVDTLDFKQLGIVINPYQVGNSQYHPRAMLKLLVYGTSYGVRSSRKLERETYHNMSFIWLMGGLKPDHKTISEFRRKNKKALSKVLKLSARMCIKLDLIGGNVLFVDGTKIRADASAGRAHDKSWYEEKLEQIDQRIEQLLAECETQDRQEADQESFVAMGKELAQSEKLKSRIEGVLAEFNQSDREKINQTDPDCATMHSPQGTHASYNVQSVVDDKNGLVVHAEAVSDPNDRNQFAQQVTEANQVLDEPCRAACADAGYANTDEQEKIDTEQITVIVPSQEQASEKTKDPFSKQQFTYDCANDCYYCPEGHQLTYRTKDRKRGHLIYQITDKQLCFRCPHCGRCTKNKKAGRRVSRLKNEAAKEKFEAIYDHPDSQQIYQRRKYRVEHPFGHLKKNLTVDSFLLRRHEGVAAETSLMFTCFNIARMITLLGGVSRFIQKLAALTPHPA
jgi:transposase